MANLPEPDWIALSESLRRVTQAFDAEPSAVETGLVAAFHELKIRTRGRCRTYFGHDTPRNLATYDWDRAHAVWEANEFTTPSDQVGRKVHIFSDVVVHREDLEKWINPAESSDSQHEHQEAVEISVPEESGEAKKPQARRRGRRPQYDWALFHEEIARIVGTDPDGFPVVQADLENTMTVWCVTTWGENNCPAESTIRGQVKKYYNDDSQGR